MKKGLKAGVSIVASAALVSSLLAFPMTASATSGISGEVGSDTNWEVPQSYMTNTVDVDSTTYKVITTWANAWALSGPDYIGVSNSGTINQSGGSSATSDLETAQTGTMLGIWASAVNEVPNAYNWNYFYNLYRDAYGEDTDESLSAVDVQNGAQGGYDSLSGVMGYFKYRPEIIWCSNSLSSSQVATYVAEINSTNYYTGETDDDGNYTVAASGTDNDYYVDGDESYDPYIVDPSRTSSYTLLDSLYELAGYCEDVEDETADYNSDGSVTSENVTWKTMNSLPRTTRYEASTENAVSATEAALDVEKVLRGSVYYTLAKIADGTVEQKKVAFVSGTPDTTGSTCTVVSYGGPEENRGSTSGKVSMASLTVEALTTDTEASSSSSGGGGGGSPAAEAGSYTATVDELLTCDYIWVGDGSLTVSEVEDWLSNNATTDESKAALDTVGIITDIPAFMNAHNFTFEKAICGIYDISFFYPELFPDLELVTYWYDNVYHIYKENLNTCLTYGLGNATMPEGTELTDLGGETYSEEYIDQMAAEGYEYYASTLKNDETFSSYTSAGASDTYESWAETYNEAYEAGGNSSYAEGYTDGYTAGQEAAADGSTDTDSYNQGYTDGAASVETDTYYNNGYDQGYEDGLAAASSSSSTTAKKAQSMKVTKKNKTVKYKKLKKKAQKVKAITVKNYKGKLSFKKVSGSKKLSLVKGGKIKVKRGTKKGTYKIKVKVTAAGNSTYKSASKTVTVKIKVK